MTLLQRWRNKRAQALVETALILPFLTLLTLGAADLGRAFYLHLEITGASRAGMRSGIQGTGNDIGGAIRSEPNTAIVNNAATALTSNGLAMKSVAPSSTARTANSTEPWAVIKIIGSEGKTRRSF